MFTVTRFDAIKKYANGVQAFTVKAHIAQAVGVSVTLGSTATAACGEEAVVLQLATTSGVVMQLNGIAESPCGNKTQSVLHAVSKHKITKTY